MRGGIRDCLDRCFVNPKRQRGWLSFEAMLAIALMMMVLPLAQDWYTRYELENRTKVAAEHLRVLQEATERYVKANWEALKADPSLSSAVTVNVPDLIADGFLPDGYNPLNPFDQTYNVRIAGMSSANPDETIMAAVVVGTGGRPAGAGALDGADLKLATEIIPSAAGKLGITGGVVPYSLLPGAMGGVIEGVNGGWTFDYSGFSGITSLGVNQGALASVNFIASGAVNNDYLYRSDIGVPELNRMETELDMNGYDIENLKSLTGMTGYIHSTGEELLDDSNVFVAEKGDIQLKDGKVMAGDVIIDDVRIVDAAGNAYAPAMSRGVFDMRIVLPNTNIRQPNCPPGPGGEPPTPQIFVAIADAPVGGAGSTGSGQTLKLDSGGTVSGYVVRVQTKAALSGSQWRVLLQAKLSNASGGFLNGGNFYTLHESEGRLLVGTKCT